MRTLQELDDLRKQAVLLRRQGKSLRQIKEILGPVSNATLHGALRGEPPPEWTRRPNAKDGLRARARSRPTSDSYKGRRPIPPRGGGRYRGTALGAVFRNASRPPSGVA
jgi:hypothetical protein